MTIIKGQGKTSKGAKAKAVHYAYQVGKTYRPMCKTRTGRATFDRVDENTPITCKICLTEKPGRGPESLHELMGL